jgi:hypothetical protein
MTENIVVDIFENGVKKTSVFLGRNNPSMVNLSIRNLDVDNAEVLTVLTSVDNMHWQLFLTSEGKKITVTEDETIIKFNPDNCYIRLISSLPDVSNVKAVIK